MSYHVIIEACPDDCMGNRVKDYKFSDYDSARSCFEDPFGGYEVASEELSRLYICEDQINEDFVLFVSVDVYLIETDIDLSDMLDVEVDSPLYKDWLNDYDDMPYKDKIYENVDDTRLILVYSFMGAKILAHNSQSFHFPK